MTSGALAGLTLVVTRPAAQAVPFIARAEAAGARCIALPTLEIEPMPLGESQRAELSARQWDWCIYTSTNAVSAAAAQLAHVQATRVAAVGGATARALAKAGITVAVKPAGRVDSEGLLQLPVFNAVRGQHVLILKGVGGRDLLATELARRGANVHTVELYRRSMARPDRSALRRLHDALASGENLAIVVTSAEILEALLQITPPDDINAIRARPLFVPGARVAAAAAHAGWTGPVVQATSAEDAAMLKAVLAAAGHPPDAC